MKLNEKKIDMQKVLAPAALVILYVFFSVVGDGFLRSCTNRLKPLE